MTAHKLALVLVLLSFLSLLLPVASSGAVQEYMNASETIPQKVRVDRGLPVTLTASGAASVTGSGSMIVVDGVLSSNASFTIVSVASGSSYNLASFTNNFDEPFVCTVRCTEDFFVYHSSGLPTPTFSTGLPVIQPGTSLEIQFVATNALNIRFYPDDTVGAATFSIGVLGY